MKKLLLLFLLFVVKNSEACDYVAKYQWKFSYENGDENYQKVTVYKDDLLCSPELDIWRERVNQIFAHSKIEDQLLASNGKVIFNSTYTTGEGGFRLTAPNNYKAKKHAILAGDSVVFGIGGQDNETITHSLVKSLPQYHVFNLGIPSRGPSSHLFLLDKFKLKKIFTDMPNEGSFVYLFNYSQIKAILGAKNLVDWGAGGPNYELDENNKLYLAGTFNDLRVTKVYKVLNYFSFLNSFIPNFPLIRQKQILTIAKVFEQLKKSYLLQSNNKNKFVVLIAVSKKDPKKYKVMKEISRQMKLLNIDTLDLENLADADECFENGRYTSKSCNKLMANNLFSVLSSIQAQKK